MRSLSSHTLSALAGAALSSLLVVAAPPASLTPEQQEVLELLSVEHPAELGGAKTLRVTGANLQVVNGKGATGELDGTGNLVVGYNTLGDIAGKRDVRSGSHNILCGDRNSYSAHSGLAVGNSHSILAETAACVGGSVNTASGAGAVTVGGALNTASGDLAKCSGGYLNSATGYISSINGGAGNTADVYGSTVTGGAGNAVGGPDDSPFTIKP